MTKVCILLAVLLLLQACGLKGDLYMPDEKQETQSTVLN